MPRTPDKRPRKARLLVVEDHAVVREGFVALINRTDDLEVCAEAETAAGALKQMEATHPDLVVLDLLLKEGDGLELIKAARAQYPDLPMLVISMQDEELYAERALRAGASGYIMKHAATDEFMDAIRAVLAGNVYLSRKMNVRLLNKIARGVPPALPIHEALSRLSDRELQVFQQIGAGLQTREIAAKLGISSKTVEAHRENIKHKLDLKDGLALVQAATRWVQG